MAVRTPLGILLIFLALVALSVGVFVIQRMAGEASVAANRATAAATAAVEAASRAATLEARVSGLGTLGTLAVAPLDAENRISLRQKVECRNIRDFNRLAVYLIVGQSNAANTSDPPFYPRPNVFNFFDGACFIARDPLLGSTGQKGSAWSRLGDKLVGRNVFDAVLLVPLAYGGSSIQDWAPGGTHNSILVRTIQQLGRAGFELSALIWHQGEANAGIKQSGFYTSKFEQMVREIRSLGVAAPIYVALASTCTIGMRNDYWSADDIRESLEYSPAKLMEVANGQRILRAEQASLPRLGMDIRLGPDTDRINPVFRPDGCHLAGQGLDEHAELWFSVLTGIRWRPNESDSMLYEIVYGADGVPEFATTRVPAARADCEAIVARNLALAKENAYRILLNGAYKDDVSGTAIRELCLSDQELRNHALFEQFMKTQINNRE
jgi:hypothetical protein